MKCKNCGAEIGSGRFCQFCGTQITSNDRRERDELNKQGCPKCGSANISFSREIQGEVRDVSSKQIVYKTVGVCRDCGHTWFPDEPSRPPGNRTNIALWILSGLLLCTIVLLIAKGKRTDEVQRDDNKDVSRTLSGVTENTDKTDKTPEIRETSGESSESEYTFHADTPPYEDYSDNGDEGAYRDNPYFTVTEEGSYRNSINYTFFVHKVHSKQNVRIDSGMIAYSPDGKVIGKSSATADLTEGEDNYLLYAFDVDVTGATFVNNYNSFKPSSTAGQRDAVEMTDYNISGGYAYVSLRQVSDGMGSFAKYKLLLYHNDSIVGTDDGYYSITAKGLNKKGAVDVLKIRLRDKEVDRIEFIFEP